MRQPDHASCSCLVCLAQCEPLLTSTSPDGKKVSKGLFQKLSSKACWSHPKFGQMQHLDPALRAIPFWPFSRWCLCSSDLKYGCAPAVNCLSPKKHVQSFGRVTSSFLELDVSCLILLTLLNLSKPPNQPKPPSPPQRMNP